MARTRRRFSAAFKAKVALEALQSQKTMAELAGEHRVHPGQITTWKQQLAGAAEEVFDEGRGQSHQQQEELVGRLYQEIGRLKVELDYLQKKL